MSTIRTRSSEIPGQREPRPAPDLSALAESLTGSLGLPGDAVYAEHTAPWRPHVPVRPRAVVAAASAADVSAAMRFAAQAGLRVSVQCTGHGVIEVGDDVLLVSTRLLDECTVAADGSARVGAGVKWARVVECATPHGFAPLNGSSSDVGVVGYISGGGAGPMARTFGLAADRVSALDVVTPDGEIRRATPTENPDLFWGLRGGKGALGIVTAVELECVPVASLYGGALFFDGEHAGAVLSRWREWCADLPESVTTSVALLQLPAMPGVPPELAERPTATVRFAFVGGDAETGERLLAPMREVAPVLMDGVTTIPYAAVDSIHSDPVDPMPAHEDAVVLRELTEGTVQTLLDLAGPTSGSPLMLVEIRQLGGALARAGEHPSAVCHRDAAFSVLCIGIGVPPVGDAVRARCEAITGTLFAWSDGAMLPNFGDRGPDCYDDATLARLRELMARYDPEAMLVAGDAVR